MASLERTGWLGLALLSCSTLVLLVGSREVRGSARPRPSARSPEREHAEVRGRPVLTGRLTGAAAFAPNRVAVGTRSGSGPRVAGADAGARLAALTARITRDGRGVPARVRFELGGNQGLELDTASDGELCRRALAPGFQIVTVTVEGRPACTRPLFLAPYREATLQLDFGAPRTHLVRVLDPAGSPLSRAVVELDGAAITTDPAGRARLVAVASGAPELVVRAPGCAWFACALDESPAAPPAELVVRLDPACVLELTLPALADPHEAVVHLLPRDPGRVAGRPLRPATPWHLASPLRLPPGTSVRLENLPAGELEIRTFHPSARLARERVLLDPARPLALTLRATAVGPAEAPARDPLAGLLSNAGLGELPRLQPLDPAMLGGWSGTSRRTSTAPRGRDQ